MHRLFITGLACLALAVVAGCGDDEDSSSSSPPPPAASDPAAPETTPETGSSASGDAVSVGMKDIKFVPESVTAKVGQKIVWTNNEAVPHNVTATDGADFESDTMQENDTFEFTPTEAGTIKYTCTIHSGQDGEIEVAQ